MCTRALWPDANGSVLVGRNMDFGVDLYTNLWALPRGVLRDDGHGGELSWTSTYGSLTAAAHDLMTVDGINEARLAAHLLWLAESEYTPRDEQRPALTVAVWLQYMLDNFATVAEAVQWVARTQVQIIPQAEPATGRDVTLHLALEDGTGDSAIIEYVGGNPRIWHSRDYLVLTNSPPYDQQLELLAKHDGSDGGRSLPGGTEADERFARAAYYTHRLPAPADQTEAVAALFSVMRNVSQPFRTPDPDKPYASTTLWRVVADLTNGLYVFESALRPVIAWARLDELDLAEGTPSRRFELAGDAGTSQTGGLTGDITRRFVDSEPIQFLPASS